MVFTKTLRRGGEPKRKHTHIHQKEEGFDMCQQAYLLPARDGPEGTLGVSHEYDGKTANDGPERSTRLTWATLAYSGVSQQHLHIVLPPPFSLFLPVCGQPMMAAFGRYLVFLMSLWVVVQEAMRVLSLHMSEWVHKEVATTSLSPWQWPELVWIKPQTCVSLGKKNCRFVFEIIFKTSNI